MISALGIGSRRITGKLETEPLLLGEQAGWAEASSASRKLLRLTRPDENAAVELWAVARKSEALAAVG